jgi:hypothetical protein
MICRGEFDFCSKKQGHELTEENPYFPFQFVTTPLRSRT